MGSPDDLNKISDKKQQASLEGKASVQALVAGGKSRTVERGVADLAMAKRLAGGLDAVQFQPLSKRVAEQREQAWDELKQCVKLLFEDAELWAHIEHEPPKVKALIQALGHQLDTAAIGSQRYHLVLRALCFLTKGIQAEGESKCAQEANLQAIITLMLGLFKDAHRPSEQTTDFLLQTVAHLYENKTAHADACCSAAKLLAKIADRCELLDKHVPMMIQLLGHPPSRSRDPAFLAAQAMAIAVAVAALDRLDEAGLVSLFEGIERIHGRTRDADVREACLEALGAMLEFGAPRGKLEANIDALYKRIDELL